MPVFPKRRFQHGAVSMDTLRERLPYREAEYREQSLPCTAEVSVAAHPETLAQRDAWILARRGPRNAGRSAAAVGLLCRERAECFG